MEAKLKQIGWRGVDIRKDIEAVILTCDICQKIEIRSLFVGVAVLDFFIFSPRKKRKFHKGKRQRHKKITKDVKFRSKIQSSSRNP